MNHLDQRRGSYNRVELVKHQGFERCKRVTKETFGTSQPCVSFPLLGTFLLGLGWIAAMIVVPSQNKRISDMLRHDVKELCMHCFSLLKRDSDVIKMRLKGLKRWANRGTVKLFDHLKQQGQFRANPLSGAKSSMRRADA